jgi:hypothetical protein
MPRDLTQRIVPNARFLLPVSSSPSQSTVLTAIQPVSKSLIPFSFNAAIIKVDKYEFSVKKALASMTVLTLMLKVSTPDPRREPVQQPVDAGFESVAKTADHDLPQPLLGKSRLPVEAQC